MGRVVRDRLGPRGVDGARDAHEGEAGASGSTVPLVGDPGEARVLGGEDSRLVYTRLIGRSLIEKRLRQSAPEAQDRGGPSRVPVVVPGLGGRGDESPREVVEAAL